MKKVLIVDDSRFMVEEVGRMLQGSEFEAPVCCRSAEEAVRQYEEVRPDVVLMDIVLPGIDGIDAARLLCERWPGAKVVMMSSLAYDETVDAARRAGAKSFLFKPFEKGQLLDVLRGVML